MHQSSPHALSMQENEAFCRSWKIAFAIKTVATQYHPLSPIWGCVKKKYLYTLRVMHTLVHYISSFTVSALWKLLSTFPHSYHPLLQFVRLPTAAGAVHCTTAIHLYLCATVSEWSQSVQFTDVSINWVYVMHQCRLLLLSSYASFSSSSQTTANAPTSTCTGCSIMIVPPPQPKPVKR